ncbi:aminopeptidase N-like [Glossina fuscipes fuscipes]
MLQSYIGVVVKVLLIAIFSSCCAAKPSRSRFTNYTHYRLPESLKPEHYTLKIVTLLDPLHLTFVGEVIIRFQVLIGTGNITLHARNLTIDENSIELIKYDYEQSTRYAIDAVRVMDEHDYYIIHSCLALLRGETYALKLAFRGPLNQLLHGYYQSSYMDKVTNETKWMSITQFEPAYARTAFPCFDEPNFRAKFKIWLGHQESLVALSNMPLAKQEKMYLGSNETDNYVWSIFEETVPIPTYLVAYSVNNFTYKLSGNYGVKFYTWSRPDIINECEFAAQIAPELYKFFESLLAVPLPFTKMNQLSVPNFGALAMENWGLITYRESSLLFSSNISSEMSRQRLAALVAHELAHQWFGNAVTLKWWSDIWMNEGFATYMSILGVHHLNSNWNYLQVESMNNILDVFEYDAQINSHALTQGVKSTAQITGRFDSLSYKKGAMLLRMLHMIVGDDAFLSGIRQYLSKFLYTADNYGSLWNSFSIMAHTYQRRNDIKVVLHSWTSQAGYPLVKVIRNYSNGNAYVTQQRFFLNSSQAKNATKRCWWIPITLASASRLEFYKLRPSYWLECKKDKENINITLNDMAEKGDWIIFNVQMLGLYRVTYDAENWALLNRTLNSDKYTQIHVLNRAQLIDDSLSLAWAGYINYRITLDILNYLQYEKDYLPWRTALRGFIKLDNILKGYEKTYKLFTNFLKYLILPTYNTLHGLNSTQDEKEISYIDLMHKTQISYWACHLEIDDCVNAAKQYFANWKISNINKIPINLRLTVYSTAIKYGNQSDWEFLWQYLQESNIIVSEQRTIIQALSCSRNKTTLCNFLDLIFNNTKYIHRQDSAAAFESIARNKIGFPIAKDYFFEHFDQLREYYGTISKDVINLILSLARQVASMEHNIGILEFLAKKRDIFQHSWRTILSAVEITRLNIGWVHRYRATVHNNLRRRNFKRAKNATLRK